MLYRRRKRWDLPGGSGRGGFQRFEYGGWLGCHKRGRGQRQQAGHFQRDELGLNEAAPEKFLHLPCLLLPCPNERSRGRTDLIWHFRWRLYSLVYRISNLADPLRHLHPGKKELRSVTSKQVHRYTSPTGLIKYICCRCFTSIEKEPVEINKESSEFEEVCAQEDEQLRPTTENAMTKNAFQRQEYIYNKPNLWKLK